MATPPFHLNITILSLSLEIQEIIGELKAATLVRPSLKLRRENKIRTIHHSLAIEGNSLTEEQISALLEKKRVIGPKKQIQEVINALTLYDQLDKLDPFSEKDLLKSHSILMDGLVENPGKYRVTNVGIMKGSKVGHIGSQAKMVYPLMKDLFTFLKSKDDTPLLMKACIFHYELEFIHPFMDGNGRMGRLWQQLILIKHSPIFEFLSIETLIHEEQKQYYKVLETCDKTGNSTPFIEFSLKLILKSLADFKKQYRPKKISVAERLKKAVETFNKAGFSRKDYLNLHRDISTATASRDLANAVAQGILELRGDKALARYFIKK